ncbi:hypothetical protein [Paenibacillus durus]|uniref:hypothetical protein n=1 Tax=Paenibacillus durus TaxID=44251 RepID=UPI00047017A2|nr:hypothetical protein [Paenibacillus durus]
MKLIKKHFKWVAVSFSTVLLLSSNVLVADASTGSEQKIEQGVQASQQVQTDLELIQNKIPKKMKPGTILTYDSHQKPIITFDTSAADHSAISQNARNSEQSDPTEVPDVAGRAAEDAFFNSVKESAKNLPVVNLEYDLPDPVPGTVVMYGSDGLINRIYVDKDIATEQVTATSIPTSTVPYPGRLPEGTYNYGTGQQIVITSGAVTGEGRFTVFRAGVGGSGTVGSSGKTLGAGDVATKRQIDNPKHNTAINARCLDNNILKTVYKNDIGELPDAVLDNYFWGWNSEYFGHMYSDTLSFSGRYFYQF